MFTKFQSLRWQIQLWHLVLLVLIVGGMLSAFYFYEKRVQVDVLDKRLWKPVHAILPVFRMSPGTASRGGLEARPLVREVGESMGPRGGHRPPHQRGGGFRPPPPHLRGQGEMSRERSEGQQPRGEDGSRGSYPPSMHFDPSEDRVVPGPGVVSNGQEFDMEQIGESRAIKKFEQRGFYIEAWMQEKLLYRSATAPDRAEMVSDYELASVDAGVEERWNGENRELVQPTPFGKIVVGVSGDVIEAELSSFRNKLIAVGLAVVLFGFFGGAWMTRRSLMPIQQMEGTAQLISNGEYAERIDLGNTQNELSGLATVLNDSFEKIEQSFAQQIRFTADASHEMRTPLAVILAKAELALARERSPEKYQEAIQACFDSAAHMQGLIESLLDLSKVDSGRFSIVRKPVDVDHLVQGCVDLLEPLAENAGLIVHCDLEPVEAMVDASRVKQVLINLLSNAIKYNVEGGRIEVWLSADDEYWQLKVIDSGEGVEEEHLQHLFDRFYRTEVARTSKEGSTGLGLAITKAIVEAHGGSITATSVVGMGSTFMIRVPVA